MPVWPPLSSPKTGLSNNKRGTPLKKRPVFRLSLYLTTTTFLVAVNEPAFIR